MHRAPASRTASTARTSRASPWGRTVHLPLRQGIAPGANIIAIQVFTLLSIPEICGSSQPCLLTADVDVMAALEWVDAHRDTDNIVAANMSLGGADGFSGDCDSDEPATAIRSA